MTRGKYMLHTDELSFRYQKRPPFHISLGMRRVEEIRGDAIVKFVSEVAGNHLLKVKAEMIV